MDEVVTETGGNPFLIRELARMLADQGRRPGSVPRRVVDATAYRLAQVSRSAQALLQTAAVAGNGFSVGVVARMLGVPVLSLLGPLDEGRAAGSWWRVIIPVTIASRTRWSVRRWPPG